MFDWTTSIPTCLVRSVTLTASDLTISKICSIAPGYITESPQLTTTLEGLVGAVVLMQRHLLQLDATASLPVILMTAIESCCIPVH